KSIVLASLVMFILVGCASQKGSATTKQATNATPGAPATTGIVTTHIATTGCGIKHPSSPGTSREMAITSGGIRRTFLDHIPAAYNANQLAPLVFVIHGHGGKASDL